MKVDNIETAIDPLTGEEFVPKRSNQKFATRENQIKFNNLKAAEERKAKARTRKILNSNRKVLKKVLGDKDEVKRSYDHLEGAGLDFGYNTHTITFGDVKWICVDDYAYTVIGENLFKIVKLK